MPAAAPSIYVQNASITDASLAPRGHSTLYCLVQVYRGATFNLAHSLRQMLHLRPRNRFEDLDGVYLVGGGTHPGSSLPVIFESAPLPTQPDQSRSGSKWLEVA